MREPDFKMIKTNGVTLRVAVDGEGPLCVLVHGFPESWYSWRNQIPALVAAGYRVAVPDMRGYGGSSAPAAVQDYDIIELSDDIAGIIDALGEDSAVLIGHDWGAPIVWTTALRHASKVRAVVGMSVPHLGRGDRPLIDLLKDVYQGKYFYQLYFQQPGVAEAELESDVLTCLRKLYVGGSADRPKGVAGFVDDRPVDSRFVADQPCPDQLPAWITEQDLAYYASQFERHGFRGALNRYRNSQRDFERTSELAGKKIEQPALFIIGEQDDVMHMIPGVRLHDMMDGHYAALRGKIEVAHAGHWVQQEQPEAVNRALLDFLDSLDG